MLTSFLSPQILYPAIFIVAILCVACIAYLFGEGKIKRAKDEAQGIQKDLPTLRAERDAAIQQTGDIQERYERAKKFLEDKPHLDQEQADLIKAVAENETKLTARLEDLAKAEENLKKVSDELDSKVKEMAELERALAQGHADQSKANAELDAAKREKDAAIKERDDAKKELAKQNEEIQKLKGMKDDAERDRDEAKKEVEKATKKLQELEQQRKELEDMKKALLDKIRALQDKLDAKKDEVAEYNGLKEKVANLKTELSDLAKSRDETLKTIGESLKHLDQMNLSGIQVLRSAAFAPLQEPVFNVPAQKVQSLSEKQALDKAKQHFVDAGFKVPDRLLYAFHTALKTSDISSLTVMAGVSGTGKSAIPKLYSEALGIHFLPLAVEPRWDSPRDLLGFFNYVTNRYEPTTLARALFQFQGVYPENFKPTENNSDFMLMAMLDEMNLARIEYYFSEFLSKLEMRRIGGEISYDNCTPFSLEVFQGWNGQDKDGKAVREPPIRLFANMNTLFVGTMNEDETTQSLSDKVIDRANVLYFGSPRKLQSNTAQDRVDPDSPKLTNKIWRSWQRKVADLTKQDNTLTNLNVQLARLGRPFGHRTFQAMMSYIANYPAVEGGSANQALADQIGMRVMPKLRGLDLALNRDTLDGIGGLINRIGDESLSLAFNTARDQKLTSGFFRWSGMNWDNV